LAPATIQTGLSDAAFTEIVSGLEEGAAVVTGMALTSTTPKANGTSTNPFMPKLPTRGQKK
jgi:hypothetical protein